MVYKLKPLELSFDFEDRVYDLGDTVDVQVELTPNADVHVREARVDLICEERFARASTGIVVGVGGPAAAQGGNVFTSTDYVPASSSVGQRRESSVHSSAVFLKDTTLPSSRSSSQAIRLQIQAVPPKHLDEAIDLQRDADSSWTFKWRLVASVNIVRGRDPKKQRTIRVKIPLRAAGKGAAPRISTPKKRTAPSS